MHTRWKAANTESRPSRTEQSHRWGGVQPGGPLRVRRFKSRAGAELHGREPEAGTGRRCGVWRVWRPPGERAAARRGWERGAAGTAAEVRRESGARRHRRRRGRSRARSCHPAQELPDDTRPRPGAHGAHTLSKQCSAAPSCAAGGEATDGEAGGARPRGEPDTPSPSSASFCLANVAAEESFGGALRVTPCRRPLG